MNHHGSLAIQHEGFDANWHWETHFFKHQSSDIPTSDFTGACGIANTAFGKVTSTCKAHAKISLFFYLVSYAALAFLASFSSNTNYLVTFPSYCL